MFDLFRTKIDADNFSTRTNQFGQQLCHLSDATAEIGDSHAGLNSSSQ
jgi:hypothetical protein